MGTEKDLVYPTDFQMTSQLVHLTPNTSCVLHVTEDPLFSTIAIPHVHCVESATPHLTCRVFGTGSGWRTGAAAHLCYQVPASTAACNGAQLPQSPLTDIPGVPAQPTLGRKAYVLLVLEHQHSPRRGENDMLEVMEEIKKDI